MHAVIVRVIKVLQGFQIKYERYFQVKQFILVVSLLFLGAIIVIASTKTGEYKLRFAKSSEIGTQAICPVTKNVFDVNKGTKVMEYKGKTYFLCCPDCVVSFQKKLGITMNKKGQDIKSVETMKDIKTASSDEKVIIYWTCPMHPQVKEKNSGQCPICGMDLEPVYKK
ncbi:MAG: hypothetical protein M0Q46_04090 [Endomicrobiales bacterium]|nr:hypothetical protein [Endomicrobiales bacterium]